MKELDHITDHLNRSLNGPAWHGSSMLELLDGVSAQQAAAHPVANIHSIWEIVLHCTVWHRAVKLRLEGNRADVDTIDDWPAVEKQTDQAWNEAVSQLQVSAKELNAAIYSFSEEMLDEKAPERDYTYAVMLHGLVGHDLYHSGQIALLKKVV